MRIHEATAQSGCAILNRATDQRRVAVFGNGCDRPPVFVLHIHTDLHLVLQIAVHVVVVPSGDPAHGKVRTVRNGKVNV